MSPQITERDNFMWLLLALVFLLFSGAMFAQFESDQGQRLVNISLMITLLIAVWSLEQNQKRWMNFKMGATLIIGSLMIGDSLLADNRLAFAQLVIAFSFLSLTTYQAWRQVMFTGTIDGNKIIGAICIYILLGVVWAFGYLLVEAIFPSSFNGLDHKQWQHNLQDMIYYSMVTLTTLGYGDITPNEPLARFMAYMESITGIFYTTVLVASLIGIRLASYHPKETENEE
jgi:voltage-gated potassium channel